MVRSPGRQVADDHQPADKDNGLLIEAWTGPVTGFADATIGETSIRLNVTCGERTARIRKVSLDGILSGSTAPAIWSSR